MEEYIRGNKEAWEEAFDMRDAAWGADIAERVRNAGYGFFNEDTAKALRRIDCAGKAVAQFCCNNGRELLSLVQSSGAARGVGFDIAENQVAFAREKARELGLPCEFVAADILEIGGACAEQFDVALITIGALCWFRELDAFFAVVSRCMKPGGVIVINELHPCTNMLAMAGDEAYDADNRLACRYSYFEHVWIGNEGMEYMAGKAYPSKTFTDFTHPLGDIISAMCKSGLVITGLQEFDYDISNGFTDVQHQGYPLSMIIQGRKGRVGAG